MNAAESDSNVSTHAAPELLANRAGIGRTAIANVIAAAGLATLIVPFPVAWISQAISPGNPVREALRGDLGPVLLFVIAPLLFVLSNAVRDRVWRGTARVRIEAGELVIERRNRTQRIALGDLTEGVIVPKRAASELQLHRRNGDVVIIEVGPGDETKLAPFLAATGIGPDRRRLRTRVGGWQNPAARAGLAFMALLFTIVPMIKEISSSIPWNAGVAADMTFRVFLLAVLARLGWLIASASLGPEIVVGNDGVSVRSIFKKRFVPHHEIARLERRGRGVQMTLNNGTSISLGSTKDDARAEALIARVAGARDVRSSAPEAAARAESLDRNGRSLADWRAALSDLAKRDVGAYRSTRLARVELLEVVANPDVPADRRIGAALSLSVAGDTDAADRIRVAAETCADERVRVALEKIASGESDDDTVDAATANRAHPRSS